MIYKHPGLKVPFLYEPRDNQIINAQYLSSAIVLGLQKENSNLGNNFVESFKKFDEKGNIFLYSDFPEQDLELGGGGDIVNLIFDTKTEEFEEE